MHESEKWNGSCSVMSTLRDPMDWSLPGSSIHGIFLGLLYYLDVFALRPSQLTEQGNIYAYINLCMLYWIHIYKDLHIYHLFEYIIVKSLTPVHYQMNYSSIHSCLSVKYHSNNEKPGSHHVPSIWIIAQQQHLHVNIIELLTYNPVGKNASARIQHLCIQSFLPLVL